jgi:hypothetical protein
MEAGSAESGVIKGYTTTSSSEFTIQGASHIGFSSSGISLKKTVNNTNTVLLIPFNIEDGTNSSFFDTTGKTITRYGNPVLINSGVSGFFGNACGSFDGDTDHLVVAAHSDFAIGYSSITYEFRMRATSIQSTRNYLLRHGTNTDVEVGITIGGSTASDWNSSGGFIGLHVSYHGIAWGLSLAGTSNVCDGNFHHIAITRNTENNVWSIYVDGVLQSSSAYTYSISNSDVNIGGQSYPGSYRSFNGQLDQVAITKSLVYTGVFTPPSNQLNYIEYAATGSPYWVHVATTDMLNVSQISKIVSLTITQVEKTDTSVRYAYTMDGGTTWKNAAGVTLSGLNDITNNGSTASSIQTLFTNFIPSSEDTLFGIAISLYSAYYTVTPSVSVLSITYDGPEHWEKNTSGYQIKTFIGVTGTVVFKRTAAGSSTVYVMARNDS